MIHIKYRDLRFGDYVTLPEFPDVFHAEESHEGEVVGVCNWRQIDLNPGAPPLGLAPDITLKGRSDIILRTASIFGMANTLRELNATRRRNHRLICNIIAGPPKAAADTHALLAGLWGNEGTAQLALAQWLALEGINPRECAGWWSELTWEHRFDDLSDDAPPWIGKTLRRVRPRPV